MSQSLILVVSTDETFSQQLAQKALQPAGFRVEKTRNPQEAEAIIQAEAVSAVILTQYLGRIDPLKLIVTWNEQYPILPVIVLGKEKFGADFPLRAFRAGALDCLMPPLQLDDLMQAVINAQKRHRVLDTWVDAQAEARQSELTKQLAQLETLTRVGQSITTNLHLDEVLTKVVEIATSLTGAEEGSLLLVDEQSGDLYMRAALNFQDEFVKTFRLPIHDTLAGQVISTGEPIFLDSATPEKIKTSYLVHTLLYVPLRIHDRVIGVLGVDHRNTRGTFSAHHQLIAATLADYAAIAIENARSYERTEIERRKLETILASIEDGVLVVSQENEILLANAKARVALDISLEDELIGHSTKDVIKNNSLADAFVEHAIKPKSTQDQVEFTNEDGRSFIAHFTPLPEVGLAVAIQDVTHFVELDQSKSEFVRTVSHDLRSPLTAILGYVELIERVGDVTDQQREFIRRVQISVRNITNLVNDLLDLGRIEAGFDKQRELVPIPVIIKYAADSLQGLIQKKQQELILNFPQDLPLIHGNPIRLRQMLQNLMDNAHKYTQPGGRVEIRAMAEAGQLIIQVEDNGPGIPTTDQPYIFNKLYRASNVPTDAPGSGLGLPIVKSIVESHNGRYWFDSKVGEGTTFTLMFPLAAE